MTNKKVSAPGCGKPLRGRPWRAACAIDQIATSIAPEQNLGRADDGWPGTHSRTAIRGMQSHLGGCHEKECDLRILK